MRSVRVKVRVADLSREMIAMRRWLDSNRCEPTRFDRTQYGEHVIVTADITSDTAAAAFAEHFDGEGLPIRVRIG